MRQLLGIWARLDRLILLIGLANFATQAWAASVAHLGKGAHGPYAAINAGIAEGFAVGETVCVKAEDGSDLVCTGIIRANQHASAILLDAATAAKIKADMPVELQNVPPEPQKPDVAAPDEPAAAEPEAEPAAAGETASEVAGEAAAEAEPVEPEPASPAPPGRLYIDYIYGLRLPVSFVTVGFDQHARETRTGSPWKAKDTRSSSPFGAGFFYEKPSSARFAMRYGLFYQYVPQETVDVDYNPIDASNYATATARSSNYGLSADALWAIWTSASQAWHADLGTGLSILRSSLSEKLTTAGGSDSGTTLASLTSTINVASLDLSAQLSRRLGSFVAVFGGSAFVPLADFGKSQSGEVNLPADAGDSDRDLAGYAAFAKHQKTSFGLSLLLGVGYQF